MISVLEDFALVFFVSFAIFFVFDRFLRLVLFPSDPSGRYYVVHTFCNAMVVLLHWRDVVAVYMHPSSAFGAQTNVSGTAVIAALHVFHVAFFRPLAAVDVVHHFVMIFIMLPLAVLLNPGHLLGHGSFWASGLPGGIDYLMLVLVKVNLMPSVEEKRINSIIQTYVRAPFCCYHALFVWINYRENPLVYSKPFLPAWAVAPAM